MPPPETIPPDGWLLLTRTWARVSGPDAARYLNGQVSIDVLKIPTKAARPACVCSAKGKLEAFGYVRQTATDVYLIDAEPSLEEQLVPRLDKYLVSDDAEVSPMEEGPAIVHAMGAYVTAWQTLAETNGWPIFQADRFATPGLDILVPPHDFPWPESVGKPWDPDTAEFHRAAAGRPAWGAELDNSILPAEAGLDTWAVDFHKGCYVGQEVVSRMKSSGKTNRKLVGFQWESGPDRPAAGDNLTTEDGEAVGKITSAATHPTLDLWRGLGYVSKLAVDQRQLQSAPPKNYCLNIIPLP